MPLRRRRQAAIVPVINPVRAAAIVLRRGLAFAEVVAVPGEMLLLVAILTMLLLAAIRSAMIAVILMAVRLVCLRPVAGPLLAIAVAFSVPGLILPYLLLAGTVAAIRAVGVGQRRERAG